MIGPINGAYPLRSIPCGINDQAPISSICLSPDCTYLATFSNCGYARIFDLKNNFKEMRRMRDEDEENIDEFICGQFVGDYLAVGGKIKDRLRWSHQDEDNHILPCAIKIFDVVEHKLVARLEGHKEEILSMKSLTFMGENYLITTSQDGYIIKWHMGADWKTLLDSTQMKDGQTCMAFNISFVPNTGNKYFLASTDEHVRLYDFEEGKVKKLFFKICIDALVLLVDSFISCYKHSRIFTHRTVIV